ncbi:MAG: putative membrane protein affecting hemolysin expression [Paracoccaceae bacterium]|jgi:uncharacterized membrane protein affecting hemolysin expression
MDDPLFVLVVIACLAVVVVLAIGIGGFGKGGEFNKKYANKLMRLRLLTQAIAIALIALYVYQRQGGM